MTEGFIHRPDRLDRAAQAALLQAVFTAIRGAGFYQPTMPRTGRPLSVQMTNLGPLGWISDARGYRYEPRHPETGAPWGSIPPILIDLWFELGGYPHPPDACLVNWYQAGSKLGLHVDQDEEDLNAPVVSVSLGDPARFRLGGLQRSDPTRTLKLNSGDVVALTGPARRCFHGVDRIYAGGSTLVPQGGRINLTLRRARRP
ncbi:MAG: alpha-ketoglutarate-dependent dioxygenase AlkB [Maricaulaceae bacterium]